jgi:GNAT superfamily N-acetyltransferase
VNAWPALRQVLFGGWLLRFSNGLTRRANSVNPLARGLGPGALPETFIAGCEALYRHHRQPTIFRLPSLLGREIDASLAARGYASEGEALVLYAAIGALAPASDPAVRVQWRPGARWLMAMAALQRHDKRQASTYRRIVTALAVPAAFAALVDDDGIAALAFGAVHNGLICYQSLVTEPGRQRRGYARRVIASLAFWAKAQGATAACLEVEAANAPALALYHRLGFSELYHYHYRRQPTPSSRP